MASLPTQSRREPMAGILIVDDDPTIRAMFSRALKDLGEIQQAANGAEALRHLGARKYDIVLLDLHMPIVDGFVLLHTLANKPGLNRETPIYVITADTSEQARIRALKRRAVYMLTKPVPIATLTALVESALRKAARGSQPPEAGEGDAPEPTPSSTTPTPPASSVTGSQHGGSPVLRPPTSSQHGGSPVLRPPTSSQHGGSPVLKKP